MKLKKVIRFASTVTALSCALLLLVDLGFILLATDLRGGCIYLAVQILFQSVAGALMAMKRIVIYC